jgi:hypothetical protein
MSVGEFEDVIADLFQPSSKANFQWKETGTLGDRTVQVFDYKVAQENSTFSLRVIQDRVITVGYHGQVFVDSKTRGIRRITEVADNIPVNFPIHAASVSVDYDYVAINNHDYLLPVGAQVLFQKGRRETALNEIAFRKFHRFGSNMKIVSNLPEAKP